MEPLKDADSEAYFHLGVDEVRVEVCSDGRLVVDSPAGVLMPFPSAISEEADDIIVDCARAMVVVHHKISR